MAKHSIAVLFFLVLNLSSYTCSSNEVAGDGSAIVEFDLPQGTTVLYEGNTVFPPANGGPPHWKINNIRTLTPYSLKLQFANGDVQTRTLLLRPAHRVRLAVAAPQALAHEMVLQTGHSGAVVRLAVSPDGARMITASVDASAVLWDIERDRQMLTLKGHTAALSAAAFSPKVDLAATAGHDGKVVVWDLLTAARKKGVEPLSHFNLVHSVQFSADGSLLLTATGGDPHKSGEGAAVLWNVADAKRIQDFHDESYGIFHASLSPDGTKVAGVSYRKTIVWDVKTGNPLFSLPLCRNVDFSSDSRLLLTDGIVWDTTSGTQLEELKYPGKPTVAGLAHNGTWAVVGTNEGLAIVWDVKNGNEIARLSHEAPVRAAAFSPDDNILYTSSGGDESHVSVIRRWTWNNPAPQSTILFDVIKKHEVPDFIHHAWFSRLGFELVTGLEDHLTNWSHEAFTTKRRIENLSGTATRVTRNKIGNSLIVSVQRERPAGYVYRWDQPTQDPVILMHDVSGEVLDYAVSQDQTSVASITAQLALWSDCKTGKHIRSLPIDHGRYVSVAHPASGPLVVSADDNGRIRVWSLSSGSVQASFHETKGDVCAVSLSPDGKHVAALFNELSRNGKGVTARVILSDAATGNQVWQDAGESVAGTFIGFGPKGKNVLAGYADGRVTVFDADTGVRQSSVQSPGVRTRPLDLRSSHSENEGVLSAAFSTDGQTLVICRVNPTKSPKTRLESWDTSAGNRVHAVDCDLDASSFALSGDSRVAILACGISGAIDPSIGANVRETSFAGLVDPATGKILRKYSGPEMFSSDSVVSLSSNADRAVLIQSRSPQWSLIALKSGQLSKFPADNQPRAGAEGYTAAELSSSGHLLLTSLYRDVELWDVKAAPRRRAVLPHEYAGWPTQMAFRHDEAQALTANATTACLWDTTQGRLLRTFTAQTGTIVAVGFQTDRAIAITSESDVGVLRTWLVDDGRRLGDLQESRGEVRTVRISPDGQLAFAAMASGMEGLWKINTGTIAKIIRKGDEEPGNEVRPSFANAVADARLSEDEKRLVVLSGGTTWVEQRSRYRDTWAEDRGGMVLAWELGQPDPIFSISALSMDHVAKSVTFTPDASQVVTAGIGKKSVICWDIKSYRQTGVYQLSNIAEECLKVKLLPDGALSTSGGGQGNAGAAVLVDAPTGTQQHVFDDITTVADMAGSKSNINLCPQGSPLSFKKWHRRQRHRCRLAAAASTISISLRNSWLTGLVPEYSPHLCNFSPLTWVC